MTSPETIIRSRQNSIYKQVRSLLRRDRRHQERAFLVEGPRFVADAIRLGGRPLLVVLAESCPALAELSEQHIPLVRVLDNELFATLSDTATSQGMIGVFPFPAPPVQTGAPPFLLVADGIQDPGNLGTLIRSAAAAGATGVFALPGTVDPWAPKTVRAAAAAHFAISVESVTFDQLKSHLPEEARIIAADARASKTYDQLDFTPPAVLIVGSEGSGLSHRSRELATDLVSIPLAGDIESLNAGVAGSILLFEGARQWRGFSER